jgi:hypothetical protein
MKTLDQIEPRTPIPGTLTAPIAGPHFIISASGSYCLTGNITVSTGSAIVLTTAVSDVTLDLNGFTIASTLTGSASGNAIDMPGSHNRITIRNGNLLGSSTVSAAGTVTPGGFVNGIYGSSITHSSAAEIHASGMSGSGIYLDLQGDTNHCTVDNCGTYGIYSETITACTADQCSNNAIDGTNILNSTGTSITGIGIVSIGKGNITNCTGTSISGDGIYSVGNIINSTGSSTSGRGLVTSGNATNCVGYSLSGPYGVFITGTGNGCRGTRVGGTALFAGIAIGCTSGGGAIASTQKFLGTP